MSIRFLLQSKNDPAPIYIRIRIGREIDIKVKTRFSISPSNFANGEIKFNRVSGSPQLKNLIIQENRALEDLQQKLNDLKAKVIRKLNQRKDYDLVNSEWINEIVNSKKANLPSQFLVPYFEYYSESKRNCIRASTIKKIGVIKSRLEKYEKDNGRIRIDQVNKSFAASLKRWCDKENYAHNTIVKTLKVIVTVCNHARENGITTHPQLEFITKGLKYQKTVHIHLTFEEIQKIIDADIQDEQTDIARDWLIISSKGFRFPEIHFR